MIYNIILILVIIYYDFTCTSLVPDPFPPVLLELLGTGAQTPAPQFALNPKPPNGVEEDGEKPAFELATGKLPPKPGPRGDSTGVVGKEP